jgi:hypothetical protein
MAATFDVGGAMQFHGPMLRCLAIAVLLAAGAADAARDVLLVLDNSGSMRANDPSKLAPEAVAQFIARQPSDARVGIVIFADQPELVVPLTPVDAGRADFAAALQRLNYVGKWTQTASAVERALYELRLNGRPDAQRAVVVMTDGIIDSGDAKRDAEMSEWLRGSLAPQAGREGVQIYGLAFTERADYLLLQSLATATGGEYFRALRPGDLDGAMRRIDATLGVVAAPAPAPAQVVAPSASDGVARERVVYAPPTSAPSVGVEPATGAADRDGSGWWWSLPVLLLVGLAVFAWRARVRLATMLPAVGAAVDASAHGLTAVLYDVYDPADIKRHEIGGKPVVIGRVSGTDPAMDYVVVDERTVGRWHATIERRGQTFWLRDEGSVNGTFVNDQRVSGEHPLKHGDMVRVHRHEFEFVIPELFDSDRTMIGQSTQMAAADRSNVSAT